MHNFWLALFGAIAGIWVVQSIRAIRGMLTVPYLTQTPPVADAEAPTISLIFAARDEAEKLRDALATMLAQDYPRYEVIAINDRSQDATSEILHELRAPIRG